MKFLLVAFTFVLLSNLAHAEGIIGDTCDSTNAATNCRSDKTFLVCEVNKCQCAPKSVWHEVKKVCVLKAQELCGVDSDHPDQSCGKFSSCEELAPGTGHLCYCMDNTTAVAGDCKANYGTACSNEAAGLTPDCDPLTFSKCQLGVCSCVDSTWNEEDKKCTLHADATCSLNSGEQPCTKYSQCKPAVPAAPTVDLTCQCQEGTTPSLGACKAKLDAPCADNGTAPFCDDESSLTCESGKCECKEGTVDIAGVCLGLFDEFCSDTRKCDHTSYLTCQGHYCGCQNGTVNNGSRVCQSTFGSKCDLPGFPLECDSRKPYDCVNNVCQCNDQTVQLEGEPICLGLLGTSCGISGSPSVCSPGDYLSCLGGVCACKSGTVNVDGECQAQYERTCNTSTTPAKCDVTRFLSCQDHSCECQPGTHEKYNYASGLYECWAGMGQQCQTPDGLTPGCDSTQFLGCNLSSHLCDCQTGTVNSGNECRLPLGGHCSVSNGPDCLETTRCNGYECVCDVFYADDGLDHCYKKVRDFCYSSDVNGGCDSLAFCNKSMCACTTGNVENGNGFCRIPLSGNCKNNPEYCDDGAECGSDGKCKCRAETKDNGEGKCRVGLYAKCEGDLVCDKVQHLECGTDKKCKCEFPYYEGDDSKCSSDNGVVGLTGGYSLIIVLISLITLIQL